MQNKKFTYFLKIYNLKAFLDKRNSKTYYLKRVPNKTASLDTHSHIADSIIKTFCKD